MQRRTFVSPIFDADASPDRLAAPRPVLVLQPGWRSRWGCRERCWWRRERDGAAKRSQEAPPWHHFSCALRQFSLSSRPRLVSVWPSLVLTRVTRRVDAYAVSWPRLAKHARVRAQPVASRSVNSFASLRRDRLSGANRHRSAPSRCTLARLKLPHHGHCDPIAPPDAKFLPR